MNPISSTPKTSLNQIYVDGVTHDDHQYHDEKQDMIDEMSLLFNYLVDSCSNSDVPQKFTRDRWTLNQYFTNEYVLLTDGGELECDEEVIEFDQMQQ